VSLTATKPQDYFKIHTCFWKRKSPRAWEGQERAWASVQ